MYVMIVNTYPDGVNEFRKNILCSNDIQKLERTRSILLREFKSYDEERVIRTKDFINNEDNYNEDTRLLTAEAVQSFFEQMHLVAEKYPLANKYLDLRDYIAFDYENEVISIDIEELEEI